MKVGDCDREDETGDDQDNDNVYWDRSRHGETKHTNWKNEENGTEVDNIKPSLLRCCVPNNSCNGNWPAFARDRVEHQNSSQIEDEMNQRYM